MKITISKQASVELEESAAYYESQQQGLAAEFLLEFEKTYQRIQSTPFIGQQILPNARFQQLHRFPYSVIYTQLDKNIVILAVAHQYRKPGYWQNRLAGHRVEETAQGYTGAV